MFLESVFFSSSCWLSISISLHNSPGRARSFLVHKVLIAAFGKLEGQRNVAVDGTKGFGRIRGGATGPSHHKNNKCVLFGSTTQEKRQMWRPQEQHRYKVLLLHRCKYDRHPPYSSCVCVGWDGPGSSGKKCLTCREEKGPDGEGASIREI